MNRALIVIAVLAVCSACKNKNAGNTRKMTLGSPEATVTTTPSTDAETGPLAYAPAIPSLEEGDTVEVKIDVRHKLFEVKRGIRFTAWLFGDSLPGPVLRVRVGQTIKFSMTDRSAESMKISMDMNMKPMPHSIDFHAAMVNPEDKYRTISPGETIHFTWTANYPGVFMYHCGTPMVLLHMISGMVGMVIVEPENGFPGKVDQEFAFVQNEYYLKKEGNIFVPDTATAMKKQPTYVTFNGKVAQYFLRPLHVKAGERVRVYFLNVGPNNATSFHVIGTILDKVWLDGNPANEMVGLQAAYLGPAQGAIMEFVLPEKGRYTFVDHSFADAEMGAMGVIVAD
jgi:nitrite reductase (NO-forming)